MCITAIDIAQALLRLVYEVEFVPYHIIFILPSTDTMQDNKTVRQELKGSGRAALTSVTRKQTSIQTQN